MFYFTSDTHFSTQRTLNLSKRPFNSIDEMDDTIISNWNRVVKNDDIVYHLGDFGNPDIINILNGQTIYLLPGNYDSDDFIKKITLLDNRIKIIPNNTIFYHPKLLIDTVLIHEPKNGDLKSQFYLYGHIHKTQMVKLNGLNVGTDCHNFKPINIDTVNFYINAIQQHYDQNVFMNYIGV